MATFTDYADYTDAFVKRTGSAGRKGLVFPLKLFLLLKYIDLKEPQLKKIISWNHHGRSYKIHNHKQFRQIILPRFFATSNETFRRQLSFWGFKRISAAGKREENGSYYHEKFLRSKDYLCRMIRRNEGSGPLPDSEQQDFERMKVLPLSDQRQLMAPESDDELFEILLSAPDRAAARRRTNNATTPSSTVVFANLSTQEQILSTTSVATEQNEVVDDIDRRRQAYRNLDLEQLLSDKNEWQWRHLQPFPIGFQPPLSQSESEHFEQVMSFVRSCIE